MIDKWQDDTIWRLKSPLPFPLKWVNSYIIPDAQGLTVIDPGLDTAEARGLWVETLTAQGYTLPDIHTVVLTHHHPDHFGLAGWMSDSGAVVRMSAEARRQTKLLWGPDDTFDQALEQLFVEEGMPHDQAAAIRSHMHGFRQLVGEVSTDNWQPLEADDLLNLGGRAYQAIHTPGHASGHLSFYDPQTRVMICGDHVIPRLSPNVSYMPQGVHDPLGIYMDSLQTMSEYVVDLALPGHWHPFAEYAQRAEQIIVHHQHRLSQLLSLLEQPLSGYAICRSLFGDKLSLHQLRFALAETLAHTQYLLVRDQLRREVVDGVASYTRIKGLSV